MVKKHLSLLGISVPRKGDFEKINVRLPYYTQPVLQDGGRGILDPRKKKGIFQQVLLEE